MFGLVILFLIIALISGYLGFSGVEIVSIEMAKIVFYIALALFVISLLYRLLYGAEHHHHDHDHEL